MGWRILVAVVLGGLVAAGSGDASAQGRRDREWREYCARLDHQKDELRQRIERSRGAQRERLERWRRDVYQKEVAYCRGERWRR